MRFPKEMDTMRLMMRSSAIAAASPIHRAAPICASREGEVRFRVLILNSDYNTPVFVHIYMTAAAGRKFRCIEKGR
jgi:hypothetical protein